MICVATESNQLDMLMCPCKYILQKYLNDLMFDLSFFANNNFKITGDSFTNREQRRLGHG